MPDGQWYVNNVLVGDSTAMAAFRIVPGDVIQLRATGVPIYAEGNNLAATFGVTTTGLSGELADALGTPTVSVNGGGDTSRALIGELMGTRAKVRGLGGFVIDGAVRDAADLGEMGMPVFARAVTPAGPYKNGPGRLLVPVALAGVCVSPGDIVLGDGDGVAVVPLAQAADVADRAEEIHRTETAKHAGYTSGR